MGLFACLEYHPPSYWHHLPKAGSLAAYANLKIEQQVASDCVLINCIKLELTDLLFRLD